MTLLASITILSAVAIRAAAQDSRTAAASPAATRPLARAHAPSGQASVREHCPQTQHAIRHYRNAYTTARTTMGLAGAPPRHWYPCPAARRRATEWRERAKQARADLARWRRYQYAWWEWMPIGWQNIGACETGYGRRPGNFRHNSGTYQGFAGFYRGSWDAFVSEADPKAGPYPTEAYNATPRQQYEVALAIWRRYGLSGWGCRGAYYR